MKTETLLAVVLMVVVLVSGFFLVGCGSDEDVCPECTTCSECPEEKALLVSQFEKWGQSQVDQDQVLFWFNIINYGYAEAVNVTVTCFIEDKDKTVLFRKSEQFGNIASTSYSFKQMIVVRDDWFSADNNALCYVSGCDDCEVLTKRIKELTKNYNE